MHPMPVLSKQFLSFLKHCCHPNLYLFIKMGIFSSVFWYLGDYFIWAINYEIVLQAACLFLPKTTVLGDCFSRAGIFYRDRCLRSSLLFSISCSAEYTWEAKDQLPHLCLALFSGRNPGNYLLMMGSLVGLEPIKKSLTSTEIVC